MCKENIIQKVPKGMHYTIEFPDACFSFMSAHCGCPISVNLRI